MLNFFKKKIFILIIFLVAIFCLTIFIFQPPGTLDFPFLVPAADKSDVGKIVTLDFSQLVRRGIVDFVCIHNPDKHTFRIGVFSEVSGSTDISCLTIYDVEDFDQNVFSSILNKPFNVRIIDRVNITWIEGNIYISNAVKGICSENYSSVPTLITNSDDTHYYFGGISKKSSTDCNILLDSGLFMTLKGGTENGSEDFRHDIDVLHRIIDRFRLKKSFGIE